MAKFSGEEKSGNEKDLIIIEGIKRDPAKDAESFLDFMARINREYDEEKRKVVEEKRVLRKALANTPGADEEDLAKADEVLEKSDQEIAAAEKELKKRLKEAEELEMRKAEIYENGEDDAGTGQFEYRLGGEELKKKKTRKVKPAVKKEEEQESTATADSGKKVEKKKSPTAKKTGRKKVEKKLKNKDTAPPKTSRKRTAEETAIDPADKLKTKKPVTSKETDEINIQNEAEDSKKEVITQGKEYEDKANKLYNYVPGQSGGENLSYDEITEKTIDEQAEEIILLAEADEIKELELLSDRPELKKMAEETMDEINSMSPKEKKSLNERLANIGLMTTQVKSQVLKNFCGRLSRLTGKNNLAGRYFGNYSKIYEKSEDKAREMREATGKGGLAVASGMGQGMGNIFRYGRIIYDIADRGTARFWFNPFRHVTAAAMFAGRSAEAAKETRFDYESVKEKTRVNDHERAYNEAWRIYEEAKKKSGSGELTGEMLEEAYKENLPKDIQERFKRGGVEMTKWYKIYFDKSRDVKVYADRLTKKLENIESDEKLSAAEKDWQRKELLSRNKELIDDLDRMVGDQGAIDNFAYGFRLGEKFSKGVATALIIDSVWRLARGAAELSNLFDRNTKGEDLKLRFPITQPTVPPPAPDIPPSEASVRSGAGLRDDDLVRGYHDPDVDRGAYRGAAIPNDGERVGPPSGRAQVWGANNEGFYIEESTKDQDQVDAETAAKLAEHAVSGRIKFSELGIIRRGEGVEHAFIRQLKADPENFGYTGDVNNAAAVNKWAGGEAHRIAIKSGFVDTSTGREIRIGSSGIDRAAYILERDENGAINVREYAKGDDGQFAEVPKNQIVDKLQSGKSNHEYIYEKPSEIKNSPQEEFDLENIAGETASRPTGEAVKEFDLESAMKERFAEFDHIVEGTRIDAMAAKQAGLDMFGEGGYTEENLAKLEWWANNNKNLPNPADAKIVFETTDFSDRLTYAETAKHLELLRSTTDMDPAARASLVELFAQKGEGAKHDLFAGTNVLEKMHELGGEVIPVVRQGNLELVYKIPAVPDIALKFTPEGQAYAEGPWLLDKHFKSLKNIKEILKFPLEAYAKMNMVGEGRG